jgi:hypothetical protein
MASRSCGSDALTFGSLMMFASGVVASAPSSARASGTCCTSVRCSGKLARIRAASEMSRVSTDTPATPAKAWMMGSSEHVASAGASSVKV